MDKLGEHVAEPELLRIYRLRTDNEDYSILFECECYDWDAVVDGIENHPTLTRDWINKKVKADLLLWTVEYPEEELEQETESVANDPFDSLGE